MKYLTKGILAFALLFSGISAYCQQTVSTAQFRSEFLEDINHTRQKGCNCGTTYMPPAPPLVWNNQLELAATGHAQDMADNNYFSHTSKDGRTMQDRIITSGYTFQGFKSEGHCKNLMNPGFKEVGIALYNSYWVQDFGGRESFSPEVQKLIKSGKYHLVEKE